MRQVEELVDDDYYDKAVKVCDRIEKSVLRMAAKHGMRLIVERDDRGQHPYIGIRVISTSEGSHVKRIVQGGRP